MKLYIKELREESEITQKELAEKIGNVQRNVSNWENGTSEPDCETILKIAEIFNVSIDELFGRDYFEKSRGNDEKTEDDVLLSRMIKRLTSKQKSALKNLLAAFEN